MNPKKSLSKILTCEGVRLKLLLLGLVMTATVAFAQDNLTSVRGVVTDATGPVTGAMVAVRGGTSGTITNLEGEFTLDAVRRGDIIIVSSIGYVTEEIAWNGQSVLNFVLREDTEELDAVVVTALGIKRSEKTLSYNVQQVDASELTAVKDANFVNSLVGKVAGVSINSGANGAGGSSRVVMRGAKSLTGSNLALYVIDGIPMFNVSNNGNASSMSDQPGTDGVADINPEDIESVTMLTGPSAAALYGNAAASGVVLITTKKGSEDRTTVTVSNSTTFSTVSMMPEMQSKYGNYVGTVTSWGNEVNSSYNPKKFFNTGASTINNVSLSTGNNRNQTYISASTTNTTGILPNTRYNRYNFSGRNTAKFFKDKLTLDMGASFVRQYDRNMTSQGIYYNPLPGLYLFPRGEDFSEVQMYERYDVAKEYSVTWWPYGNNGVGMQNPYWVQNRELRENNKKRYMANASLKWQILDWLDVTGRIKIDNYDNRNTYKIYASTDLLWAGENGAYRDVRTNLNNTYGDIIATVNKSFGSNWTLNVNLGASLNDSKYEQLGYVGNLSSLPNFFTIHNLSYETKFKPRQSGYHDQSQAIFANVEVGWKSMLYLTLTGRNDWESQLAYSNYTSFFYPSVGLSAVISSMVNLPDWFTFLKVRGSYTEVGNSYDRFMTTITYPFDEESKSWSTSTTYPNLDLKPERTKSWEFGFNAKFLSRINIDMTYYRSNTFNQTFSVSLPSGAGYSSVPVQSGNILNEGIELALGYDDKWGDVTFSTNYTFTLNRNKIVKLVDNVTNPYTGAKVDMSSVSLDMMSYGGLDAKITLVEGGTMGDVYAQHLLTRDFNGYILDDASAGLTMESKETKLGSIFPKANMGWNTHVGWKGIDVGATFAARLGGIVLSATESYLDLYGVSKLSADYRDAGGVQINSGMVTAQQYLTTIAGYAAYYTYDATNVRLQELTVNYTLPSRWFADKVNVTIGFVGKNLWMIYCKAPFDPELSGETSSTYYQGYDNFMMPSTRTLGFNVKLQF